MACGAAYPAPELVELAQAEAVCIFNDQGIGIGNVQTGFNNGGAHKNLNVSLGHGGHDLSQSVLAHLPVGHAHRQAGNALLQGTGALVDGLRPIVQVEDLPAPFDLPADGIVNNGGGVFRDISLDGVPVRRGFFDGGHIPNAGQGHIEGTGNGGGGQRQHIHTLGDLFQPLLVGYTEALLLVHHQQPQILEFNAFLQKLVGADDQIHIAAAQFLQGPLLLLWRAESAEHVNGHREAPEPGHGGLVVLLGKHRGGHQNGHLLAVHDRLHHGPQGDFCFAEAHVTAEQPVHGNGGLHILFDVRNAAQLVVGFGIGEVVLEFLLPGCIGGEGIAGLPFSGGV